MTAPETAAPPRRFFVGLLLAAGLAPLNSTMIAVALPVIGREFAAEPALLTQWLVTSYLMLSLVMQSPGGKIGDLWGRSLALRLGLGCFLVGALIGSTAFAIAALVAARLLMALGGALLLPAAMAAMRNVVAAGRRGRMFGLLGAILGLAAAIGPPLGGWLTEHFGWASVFWINAPVIMLALLLIRGLTLERDGAGGGADPAPPRLDLPGVGLLGVALLTAVGAVHSDGAAAWAMGAASLVSVVALLAWELRTGQPVLDPRLFRRWQFSAGLGVGSVQNFCLYGLLFQLPFMLQELHGEGATVAGRILLAMTGGMVVASPLGGRFADRFGARTAVFMGSLVGLSAMATLWFSAPWSATTGLIPWMFLVGVGVGVSTGPAQAAALSAVEPRHSGMASGALSMFRYVASVSAITLLGVLLAYPGLSPVGRYQAGFGIYGISFLVTALLALALPADGVAGRAKAG